MKLTWAALTIGALLLPSSHAAVVQNNSMPPGTANAVVGGEHAFSKKALQLSGPISTTGAMIIDVPAPKTVAKSSQRIEIIGQPRIFADLNLEDVDVSTLSWTSSALGTRSATLVVRSAGAVEIRTGLHLSGPVGEIQIRASGSDSPNTIAEVDDRAIQTAFKTGVLWTPLTRGESQVIQFQTKSGPFPSGRVFVFGISHLSRSLGSVDIERLKSSGVGASLSCQIDVACVDSLQGLDPVTKTAFDNKVASTALLGITKDTGETGFCTGTLLNNDYHVPIFITAHHCIGSPSEANNAVTLWNFQATSCQGSTYSPGTLLSGGSIWLSGSQELDQTLIGLRNLPPSNSVLSAWDARPYSPGTLMLGMHHPRGDLKKTSIGTINGFEPAFTVEGVTHGANEFYSTNWLIGLAEPGSSGSGLFIQPPSQTYLALIGTLFSGPTSALSCAASTTYVNTFSRLDLFFPSIEKFLVSNYSPNYTDLWWNPNETGWGINIQHQGDVLFATWFTYDQTGGGMWLVMPGLIKQTNGSYQGPIYRTTGTPFSQINGAPAVDLPLNQVGSASLSFSANNNGVFSYSVNGFSGAKAIQRQSFSTPSTCQFTLSDRAGATNYQDLWFNSNEPGWGINIAQQGNIVFATWFTYDTNRVGMWLVMPSGSLIGPNTFQGALYRTTGTPFNLINGAPAINAPVVPIGTLTLQFLDGEDGVMSYTVNGITGSKAIQREVFAYPQSNCH